ncbi:MAG TPA: tetratricopeptide repeat protein, partial [Edaphobacter sp.]
LDEARNEAEAAVALAPQSVAVQVALGDVLAKMGQHAEAQAHYQQALHLAQTVEPELQERSLPMLQDKLAALTASEHKGDRLTTP